MSSANAQGTQTSRRGQALTSVLIGLAVVGAFALTAVIMQPNLLQGGLQRARSDGMPASPDRRETLEKLAALIASSAEVIAVHQRSEVGERSAGGGGGSPFVEIVLRLHDAQGSDFISRDEIAVISHSRVLQTVMFYSRKVGDSQTLLTRSEVASPQFCNLWRLDPAVEPRIIAVGVSDLRAELAPRRAASGGLHDRTGDRGSMTLGLTWPGDSPDAQEEAKVVLEVRLRAMP